MDPNKIYTLSAGAWHIFLDFGPAEKITIVDDFERIGYIKSQKIKLTSYKEKRPGDIARFMWIYKLYSKKFIDLMRENSINNFKEYPVKIMFPKNCPTYYYLDIFCKKIPKHKERKKGFMDLEFFSFDLNDWGREDIFTIENTFWVLCTEKVKNLVVKNKLKNFKFEEVHQVK